MQCEHCLDQLELDQSFASAIKAQASEGQIAEPVQRRNQPFLMWAAALLLLGNLGLATIILRQRSEPQAIKLYTLIQSRGSEENLISAVDDDAWLVVRQPWPESGETFEVSIAREHKSPVWRKTLPRSGDFMEIAIPGTLLEQATYSLTLRDPASNWETTYRFTVAHQN